MEETAPALHSSGSTDVECHACVGKKRKAEQSCIECSSSYCEHHLLMHNSLHVGKRHRLVEPNTVLQENICLDHGKMLFVFCRTDQLCICHLCITDKHRGHDVIPVEEEVVNKQVRNMIWNPKCNSQKSDPARRLVGWCWFCIVRYLIWRVRRPMGAITQYLFVMGVSESVALKNI